jgi:hypothetical protein
MGRNRSGVVEVLVDLSKRDVAADGFTTGDTIQVYTIKAGTLVKSVVAQVLTVEGAAATVDVGDSGDDNCHFAALDVNTAGYSVGLSTAKLYEADDYLLVTLGGTLGVAKGKAVVSLCLEFVDMSNQTANSAV